MRLKSAKCCDEIDPAARVARFCTQLFGGYSMAFRFPTSSGEYGYNVNYAVGAGGVNRRDDVFLVQWMLHRIYSDALFPLVGGKHLTVDGYVGPQTVQWIAAFQARVRSVGHSCHVDGRVDSARKQSASVTKTVYTIIWLNSYLRQYSPAAFAELGVDPTCPRELLNALAVNTGEEGPYVPVSIGIPATGGV
jgi:hypothetical protein